MGITLHVAYLYRLHRHHTPPLQEELDSGQNWLEGLAFWGELEGDLLNFDSKAELAGGLRGKRGAQFGFL